MGDLETIVKEVPPQPEGTAPPFPTPQLPPPPPPPLPSQSGVGDANMSVVPNQDDGLEAEQVGGELPGRQQAQGQGGEEEEEEEEEEEQEGQGKEHEGGGRVRATATQALSLSGELVPVTSTQEAPDDTPNYHDWKDLFPELKALVDGKAEIAAECAQVAAWKAWPEKHYDEGGTQDWKVFPFVHTFPAYDESRRTWIETTCARCPATTAILRRLPNIRTALFSRLGGGSRISGHRGWADLANHVLRCHLPLKVPSDGPCGLWVNEEVRHHVEGEIIVFDDSKLHKAFNESSEDRLVLIVDILRPPDVPLGTADGEHTPELDKFIDAFR